MLRGIVLVVPSKFAPLIKWGTIVAEKPNTSQDNDGIDRNIPATLCYQIEICNYFTGNDEKRMRFECDLTTCTHIQTPSVQGLTSE